MFKEVFETLYNLPREGIYAIRNEQEKSVYISYSKDLLTSVSKNVKQIKEKVHICNFLNREIEELEFGIIETLNYYTTKLDIHCLLYYHITEYRNKGYTVIAYRNIKPLRFRVDIGQDCRVYCKLITKDYKEYVVGVFNNKIEAKDFIKQYQDMDSLIYPIYSINDLTKEYIETLNRM